MKSRLVLQNDRYVFLHSDWFIYFIMGSRGYGKTYFENQECYIMVKNKTWFKLYDKKFTLSKAYEKLDKLKKKFPNKEFKLDIIKK